MMNSLEEGLNYLGISAMTSIRELAECSVQMIKIDYFAEYSSLFQRPSKAGNFTTMMKFLPRFLFTSTTFFRVYQLKFLFRSFYMVSSSGLFFLSQDERAFFEFVVRWQKNLLGLFFALQFTYKGHTLKGRK